MKEGSSFTFSDGSLFVQNAPLDLRLNVPPSVGLFNTGFEIRGYWDGKSVPLEEFLEKVRKLKGAMEHLSKQKDIHPDDQEVIRNALK